MKVLVISVSPPAAIPEADHAYHQSRHLADSGHEVHLLTQQGSVGTDDPLLTVNAVMTYWGWSEMPLMMRVMRRTAPDAILLNYVGHAYDNRPMITFAATLARLLCPKAVFVSQISYPRGAHLLGSRRRLLHRAVTWLAGQREQSPFGTLLRDSTRIVVLSNKHLAALEESHSGVSAKATLIPPPLIMPLAPDDDNTRRLQREKLGIGSEETLLAYFGYVYRGKGIETLLKAFHLLSKERGGMRLILVGGGASVSPISQDPYVRELRQLMEELGIVEKVQFTGGFPWDSDQGSRYLRAADVAVLPFDQGVSLNNSSFAAAVTHGLPTVTTEGETLEEPLRHRQNVFLCPPQNPAAFAEAILTILADAGLRTNLHTGALDIAQSCFSWDVSTTRTVEALQKTTVPALPVICYE